MVDAFDNTVPSVNTVGVQTITVIELIAPTPPIFFRQSFSTTP